MQLLVF